ncbi:hypothetical protein CLU79DRAFT_766659 [Phycomyces nitens]|nr:hypothetical protein CLU79DRAFT_766659 [Phycomyces nitens]
MDFCVSTTAPIVSNDARSPTSLSLQELINAPENAESLLDRLTPDQLLLIEQTIHNVKRRKLDKVKEPIPDQLPSPVSPPPSTLFAIDEKPLESPSDPCQERIAATSALANALAAALSSPPSPPQTPDASTTIQRPWTTSPPANPGSSTAPLAPSAAPSAPSAGVAATASASAPPPSVTSNEPLTEVRDGIEWVSFVYSHNRTLKRYSIRTDITKVSLNTIDEKFKTDNCVYPRANLPKETYKGNRWAYETECNLLGWKLAWLNKTEISGKRGLIQRAVDSYRNRYPSMRSRRVARQEKLLNGTLRKRKNREGEEVDLISCISVTIPAPMTLAAATVKPPHQPKTIAIDDVATNMRYRIKINVENVDLDEISPEFRIANCVFPRAMNVNPDQSINGRARWVEETMCNELVWKLAWLNQRHLANKKNLLQRALDIYRSKFMPSLQPRKNSKRTAPIPQAQFPDILNNDEMMMMIPMPLTASALSAQNARFAQDVPTEKQPGSPATSCTSGTTESLDFGDCFSLADEPSLEQELPFEMSSSLVVEDPIISPSYSPSICMLTEPMSFCNPSDIQRLFSPCDESSTIISSHTHSTSSSSTTSAVCTPNPPPASNYFLGDSDIYDSFMLPPILDDSFLDHSLPSSAMVGMDLKFLDPLASPSSAVHHDLVKMEEMQDFSPQFLDPLF